MTYDCQITSKSDARDVEFVAYAYPLTMEAGVLPAAPGAALYDGAEPVSLQVAPGRWLLPAASDALRAQLQSLMTVGAVHDVEGKWRRFDLVGPGAAALLAETIDIVAVLAGRDCAAVLLFDCPSIVARRTSGFTVWTRSSHRTHLQAEFARLTGR